ncbi:MAG: phosphodiesterase [Ruminococcaceae bacterium]|nr:phosphodiesterase [Oscillospiraceae bacterium]
MKLLIASDLHGGADACTKLCDIFAQSGADRLILLGDVLYHGPRNDPPEGYAPKRVIPMLNNLADKILCVRGNCDAEVDGMMLDFDVLTDSRTLFDGDLCLYLHHGHHDLPALAPGTVVLYGHTHVVEHHEQNGLFYFNPGSVTIPKGGNPPSYMLYENRTFTAYSLDGVVLFEKMCNARKKI